MVQALPSTVVDVLWGRCFDSCEMVLVGVGADEGCALCVNLRTRFESAMPNIVSWHAAQALQINATVFACAIAVSPDQPKKLRKGLRPVAHMQRLRAELPPHASMADMWLVA